MLDPKWKNLIRRVLMAYAETGWEPSRGQWQKIRNHAVVGGCALGVLGQANNCAFEDDESEEFVDLLSRFRLSEREAWALIAGFDCESIEKRREHLSLTYSKHWQACRAGAICARLAHRKAIKEVIPVKGVAMHASGRGSHS